MKVIKATLTVYIEETGDLENDAKFLRGAIESSLLNGFMPEETLVEDWFIKTETKG